MSTVQIRFRQPGTASLQKTLTVRAETEEQAIRIARKASHRRGSAMTQFSFEQFQATRIRCEDLGTALGDATLLEQGARGFLYLPQPANAHGYSGGLYIKDADPGEYRLQLDEDVEVTSDLEGLERRLFQYAVGSGLIEADRFAEALENFVNAATAVLEQWDEDRVPAKAYPAYLPSFDEFVVDLIALRDAVV
jgi:hypothetical protein